MKTSIDDRLNLICRGRHYLELNEWITEDYFGLLPNDELDLTKCDVIGALAAANGWYDKDSMDVVVYTDELVEVITELNNDLPDRYDDITTLNDAMVDKRHVLDQIDKTIDRLQASHDSVLLPHVL